MKILLILAVLAFLCSASASFAADAPAASGKVLYHVVSVKFKASATPEQIKTADEAFAALKAKIPGITSLHWGDNVSPEKHDHGYTQCFVLTFASDKDRDAYLVHPDHKAFGKILGPVLAEVMVIDFWAKD
jgi:ABC-type glycerol-3-phosphate transport system substrate-binding protein